MLNLVVCKVTARLQKVNYTLQYIIHSTLSHIGPKVFLNILLSKDLRAFSSANVSNHISAAHVTTGHTTVL